MNPDSEGQEWKETFNKIQYRLLECYQKTAFSLQIKTAFSSTEKLRPYFWNLLDFDDQSEPGGGGRTCMAGICLKIYR